MRGRIENPFLRPSDIRSVVGVGCHVDRELLTGDIVVSAVRRVRTDYTAALPEKRDVELLPLVAGIGSEIVEGGCCCPYGNDGCPSGGESC